MKQISLQIFVQHTEGVASRSNSATENSYWQ